MIWLYLSYAFVVLGAVKLAMMLIMQIAGDINDINLQLNYGRLKRKKGIFKPKISAVMLAKNITTDFDLYVDSVLESSIQPNEFVVFVNKKDRAAYNKLRYYRQKHGLSGYIKLVRYKTNSNLANIIKKNCKGTYLVIMDGNALLTPKTLDNTMALFRNEKMHAVLPHNIPKIDSTLKSGVLALAKVVKANYFRAQPIATSELNGVMVARKSALLVLANNGMLLNKMGIAKSLKASGTPSIVRNPLSLIRAINVDKQVGFNLAVVFLWLMDLAAIMSILYIRGSYEGWILIGFVSILVMFLIAIAIFGYKGLSFMNRINLIFLAPITYIAMYLSIVMALLIQLFKSIKKLFKPRRNLVTIKATAN
jgi:hypothetical protein